MSAPDRSDFGIDTDVRDGIAWVVLRNPARLNALRLEMWEALPATVAAMSGDACVRVVVLRGHGT